MKKVKYIGATDTQVNWGSCGDPRSILIVGKYYFVEYEEVHNWHTKIKLYYINGEFNSVSFEEKK